VKGHDNHSSLVTSAERSIEGGPSVERRIRIADQAPKHREQLRAQGYAPSTIRRYADLLRDFERFLESEGIEDLREVRREHVEGFKLVLRRRKYSQSSQAQALQAVSKLFDDLCERGLLLLNPTDGVERVQRTDRMPRNVPSVADVRRLLAAVNTSLRTGIRDRAVIEVLYGSLLRVGELVALQVHDVDLDHRLLRIERSKTRRGRVVPIGAVAQRWLREYLDKVRPWWAKRAPNERTVFLTNRAEAMNPNAIRQSLLGLCNTAKLGRISPHALRHAGATHMLAAGADIRHVQKLLGHQHLASTQVYTHVAPTEVKATHARTHPREREL
jgi:site-specific recombinase XerD